MAVNQAQGGGSSRDCSGGCDPSRVVVTTVRAHSSDATGAHQGPSPIAPQLPPTPHHTVALGLGQRGPETRLPQKQPRFLVPAALPQFTPQNMQRDHRSPTFPAEWFQTRVGVTEVGHSDQLLEKRGLSPRQGKDKSALAAAGVLMTTSQSTPAEAE